MAKNEEVIHGCIYILLCWYTIVSLLIWKARWLHTLCLRKIFLRKKRSDNIFLLKHWD